MMRLHGPVWPLSKSAQKSEVGAVSQNGGPASTGGLPDSGVPASALAGSERAPSGLGAASFGAPSRSVEENGLHQTSPVAIEASIAVKTAPRIRRKHTSFRAWLGPAVR
jgi:hypothetical protein